MDEGKLLFNESAADQTLNSSMSNCTVCQTNSFIATEQTLWKLKSQCIQVKREYYYIYAPELGMWFAMQDKSI